MKKTSNALTLILLFVMTAFPMHVVFVPPSMIDAADHRQQISTPFLPEDCFAANPGAGNTDKLAHAEWARRQTLDTLVNDLWQKIVMVYGCTIVSNDQAYHLFGEISGLIARRAPDARCFGGDRGVINTDDAAHERWARTKTRTEVRDNLGAKSIAALRCLDAGHNRVDFFATASMLLAYAPTRSGRSPSCDGRYGLSGVPAARTGQTITVNYFAPLNRSDRDWIGIFPSGVYPAEGRTVAWQWVPKGACSGYVVIRAPAAGRYYIYYLQAGSYTPVGGGVALTVNP